MSCFLKALIKRKIREKNSKPRPKLGAKLRFLIYKRLINGPDSNFTNLTTHTNVNNKYIIKNISKVKLEDSYKIPTAVLFNLTKLNIFLYFIKIISNNLKIEKKIIFLNLILSKLNFSFAAKVLIYIIKIITPPKKTKMIK